jgi:hypothetical protein
MKKLFPILAVLVLISTACQLGGGQAQPTPLAVATAFPTNTPIPLPNCSSFRKSIRRRYAQFE